MQMPNTIGPWEAKIPNSRSGSLLKPRVGPSKAPGSGAPVWISVIRINSQDLAVGTETVSLNHRS